MYNVKTFSTFSCISFLIETFLSICTAEFETNIWQINIRENRSGNPEWTIQEHWWH
jgi:hypothetical protein